MALGLLFMDHAAYGMDGEEKPPHVYHIYGDDYEYDMQSNKLIYVGDYEYEQSKEYASHPALTPQQKNGEESPLALAPTEIKGSIIRSLRKEWHPGHHKIISLRDYLTISRINREFNSIANSAEELKVPYQFRSDKYTDPSDDRSIILPITMPATFLQSFTRLTHLDLCANNVVTDDCLEQFASTCTTLTRMDLSSNRQISDKTLALFTTLKVLNLGWMCGISGQVLASLTGLKKLHLSCNETVEDSDLAPLTGLQKLNIRGRSLVTDTGLALLTKLQALYVSDNPNVTLQGISSLPIKRLSLSQSSHLFEPALVELPCLAKLKIECIGEMDANAPRPEFYQDLKTKGIEIVEEASGEEESTSEEDID